MTPNKNAYLTDAFKPEEGMRGRKVTPPGWSKPDPGVCLKCGGSGESPLLRYPCSGCNGTGNASEDSLCYSPGEPGPAACETCNGGGLSWRGYCPTCKGTGNAPTPEDAIADELDGPGYGSINGTKYYRCSPELLADALVDEERINVRLKAKAAALRDKVTKLEVERDALGEQYYDAEDKLRQQMRGVREMVEKKREAWRPFSGNGRRICETILTEIDRITGVEHTQSKNERTHSD